jgi:hypothetical protein
LDTPSSNNSSVTSTSTDEGPIPQGATFSIQTPSGIVTVNNFYQGQTIDQNEPGVFIVSTSTYSILYLRADSSFEIDLGPTASASDRTAAETAFVAALGINQSQACDLSVTVYEPIDNNSEEGSVGGLSFCSAAQGGGFQTEQFNVQ